MISVLELRPGDSVLGWMRIGFALRKGRTATGVIYRYVPSKPERFSQDDLQQFTGHIMSNDTERQLLRIAVSRMNRFTMPVEASLPAEIHYGALLRLRKLSSFAHSPKPQNPLRPTAMLYRTGNHPYRTAEEVSLRWR